MILYRGATTRGRVVVEDSLQAAVELIAYLASKNLDACVTVESDEPDDKGECWYVYESQIALDTDLARGPIGAHSPGWFGVVRAVEGSAS